LPLGNHEQLSSDLLMLGCVERLEKRMLLVAHLGSITVVVQVLVEVVFLPNIGRVRIYRNPC
jgi:hypothetical protein